MPSSDVLVSSDGRFRLLMQNDGNLVIYGPDGAPTWASKDCVLKGDTPQPPPPPPPPPTDEPWRTVTEDQLRQWQGRIATVLWDGPLGFRPGASDNAMFTAQYENPVWTADERRRMLAAAPDVLHWPMGPLVQKGYHGKYPDTDFTRTFDTFLDRVEELWRAGKYPVVFLLDDTGRYADGNGVNREAIERDLTPLYASPRAQALLRVVVSAWEPDNWSNDDWQWVTRWMARVLPNALRGIHFPTGKGAPGRHSDLESGAFANEAALWNTVLPFIHFFLQQETWIFGGEDGWVQDGRTPEQQFEYDLMDSIRRFTFGTGAAASAAPAEIVARWDAVRGQSSKRYTEWDGTYRTTCAAPRPLDVVAFEWGSYYVCQPHQFGTPAAALAASNRFGQIAASVWQARGTGDGR